MSDTSRNTLSPTELPQAAGEEVLRLATAYQASRALHVAIRLGLPDLPAKTPRPRQAEVASTIGVTVELIR